jgi:hypothetical protein
VFLVAGMWSLRGDKGEKELKVVVNPLLQAIGEFEGVISDFASNKNFSDFGRPTKIQVGN